MFLAASESTGSTVPNLELIERLGRVVVLLVVGIPAAYVLSRLVERSTRKRFSPQTVMLLRRGVFYGCLALLAATVLPDLGFKVGPLLGAAGVVGVALGFASQTSVSNIISGLFLIWEKPFAIGDVIDIEGTTGIILSIDLLSVKLRTFDNRFVRIPNETLIKNRVTNITRFPIRRLDINVGVAYKEDPERVRDVLMEIARDNPLCLDEPAPIFVFQNFGDSALEFLFAVWFEKADFLALKTSMMTGIKRRFDAEGIEIPFPHLSLYTGAATEAFPVRLVSGPEAQGLPRGASSGTCSASLSGGSTAASPPPPPA
ncbi:MAG: mechanosensitive ion channel family protein [Lentisphaeria bacterium]|nr:mechanosensitive ion channel family protein [Lentisphaeria bacterium]